MCSMSLTFEVRLRSKPVTTRFSISSGDRPEYTHRTLTMGMSMYGKDVDRHGDDGRAAQDGDEHRHHDEGVRAAES